MYVSCNICLISLVLIAKNFGIFAEACNKVAINENAIVVFKENQPIKGQLVIQVKNSVASIKGEINGLKPESIHGMHIHEFGDVSKSCTSTGSHFNPTSKKHGSLTSTERHLGDLGNFRADMNGKIEVALENINLGNSAEHSIIGRAIVLHAGEDDIGLNGNEGSVTTGNSGARLTCGIIARRNTKTPTK